MKSTNMNHSISQHQFPLVSLLSPSKLFTSHKALNLVRSKCDTASELSHYTVKVKKGIHTTDKRPDDKKELEMRYDLFVYNHHFCS